MEDAASTPDAVQESAVGAAPQYVPLHVHSDFSLLDGASQVPALAARAAELGVPALALTDHGVLYGAVALVRACRDAGVKPVIGNEMYVVNGVPGAPPLAPPEGGKRKWDKRYHLVVLAKNTVGYGNLVKLTTMSHLHGKVGHGIFARPCVNKAQLFQFREGLIVSSGCLGGEIAQAILNGRPDVAREVARWYRDVFGDDYYLEIQDHGSAEDVRVNMEIVVMGRELGIKVIATNDSHFTSCLDAEAHDALICIQTRKVLTDEKRLRYAGNEYFKSVDEMRNCFIDHLESADIETALVNTLAVADKVEPYDLFGETRIPHYPIPASFTDGDSAYLRHIAQIGLAERLSVRWASGLAKESARDEYAERLEFEVRMIEDMGFSSYFLVVWDYIRFAREQGIPVGPGRGSAAGSLVAFALRITDVDPIAFNLLFERFLNPERRSMPDIDTDFSVEGREKVIAYVSERYGKNRVAQIITFNRLTSKAVLKDMARVHSVPYKEADKLAKLIPVVRGKPATLTKMLGADSPSPDFKKLIESNEHRHWIEKARRIEGSNKTFGIHAAGVVISASPLTHAVPLSVAQHGEIITQYPMEDVEQLGLLKMDFLGLKNLSVIESALRFINAGRRRLGLESDLDFSVDALPLDDPKTFELLSTGELDGIFQLDASLGMRNIVRELRPSSLEDISSILALYRPGPLDAGLIPQFIRRKHGEEAIEYDHPLLEPILKDTYGVMVYQEQIMRIARDLAGYSLGEADILRRAMGKKKVKDMEKEKPKFVAGAVERGVPQETATGLFEMMIQFAEYCFNKSHSTAYAYLTYQTAYLKANYPVEYTAALLRANMSNSDKLVRYLADANVSGVKVLPPSVNRSELAFTVHNSADGENEVLFGLEAVKAVGSAVGEAIINERRANGPFSSIIDLVERVDSRVLNKRSMGALVLCGAFDELHANRKTLLDQLDDLLTLRRKLRDRRKRRAAKEMSEEKERVEVAKDASQWEEVQLALEEESRTQPDFTLLEKLSAEKQTLGFYASGHPLYDLDTFRSFLQCTNVTDVVGDGEISSETDFEGMVETNSSRVEHGAEVALLSVVSDLNIVKTARGHSMAKWMVEDQQSRVQGIVFPSSFPICEQVRPLSDNASGEHAEQSEPVSDKTEKEAEDAAEAVEPEPEKVVAPDARVVVWGRVDLESSGNVQLFIDDVQRVEDVVVVMATAEYDEDRDQSVQASILRRFAGEFLGVLGEDVSMSYSYKNNEGQYVTRQRRPAKLDYKTKRRKPLILRVLAQDGTVSSMTNLGSRFRFGDVTQEELLSLARITGLHFEEVNAFEGMKQSCDLEVKKQPVIASNIIPLNLSSSEMLDAAEIDEEESALEEAYTPPVDISDILSDIATTSLEVSLGEDNSIVDDDALLEVNSSSVDLEDEPKKPPVPTEIAGKMRGDYPGLSDEQFQRFALDCAKLRELPVFPVPRSAKAASPKPSLTPVAEVNSSDEREPPYGSQQPGSNKTLTTVAKIAPASFTDNKLADAVEVSEPVEVTVAAPPSPHSEYSESSLADNGTDVSLVSGSSSASSSFEKAPTKANFDLLLRKVASLEEELSTLRGKFTILKSTSGDIGDLSDSDVSVKMAMDNDALEEVQVEPSPETLANINESIRVSSEAVSEIRVDNEKPNVSSGNGSASAGTGPEKNSEVSGTPSDLDGEDLDFVSMWKNPPARKINPSRAQRTKVHLGSYETSRLLDLICFVAGDAAYSHCQDSFQVLVTSGFDLSKCTNSLSGGFLIDLFARVVSVDLNCISVIVRIREHAPTNGRERMMTLTSGVVVFHASSPVEDITCKSSTSRNAKKQAWNLLNGRKRALLKSKRLGVVMRGEEKQRMRSPRSAPVEDRLPARKLVPSDTVVVSNTTRTHFKSGSISLSDGGQILEWMSAAAQNCAAENIVMVDLTCVEAMELLHVPHSVDLESDWDAVCIRAKLSYTAFGAVTVDVAAQLLSDGKHDPKTGTIQAIFKIACSPFAAVSSIRFCEENWMPFDPVSLAQATPLLEQLCAEMGE